MPLDTEGRPRLSKELAQLLSGWLSLPLMQQKPLHLLASDYLMSNRTVIPLAWFRLSEGGVTETADMFTV